MADRLNIILLLVIWSTLVTEGQETAYGPGYQTVMISNPAFTGSEGDGTLRLSYLNYYPGNNFNLHSVFVSYDSYIPVMHGGAGFWLTNDYIGGIVNDIRGGFSYAYHFQADKNLFINAGLAASCYYRGYNNGRIILPDQIDPLGGVNFPSAESISEKGRAVLDIGTGIMVMSGKFIVALALNHLAAPYLAETEFSGDQLERKLVINLAGNFDLKKNPQIVLKPIINAELQGSFFSAAAGGSIENNSLSISSVLLVNNAEDVNLQAGCSLRSGLFLFFYNYRFNISSGNRMLPVSLLHQTGLSVSLNIVDKRKIIKTINFPKM